MWGKIVECFKISNKYNNLKMIMSKVNRLSKKFLPNLRESRRFMFNVRTPCRILGIETSCDDTGCAILDENGKILGEALNSQQSVHLENGGIIPPIAQDLHRINIADVVSKAAEGIDFKDIDAIAVTTKPGLPLSLEIGTKYAKFLCRIHNKPLIPIHHMEAHALTARLSTPYITFPYLVLLISGGHCLIAVAQDVNKFLLLGESIDDAPGEAFDKLARRMKLRNLPEFANMGGGQAIEIAASKAKEPLHYNFPAPMTHHRDCNFSFAGIKTLIKRKIVEEEHYCCLAPDEVIPNIYNLAAGMQIVVLKHLCHRVQRAMEFVEMHELIPKNRKRFVVSGGVACNNFLAGGLRMLASKMGYTFFRPPNKLCTDNGVMIAWNGVEKWKRQIDIRHDLDEVKIQKVCPLGTSMIQDVQNAKLSCKWVKLESLLKSANEGIKTVV